MTDGNDLSDDEKNLFQQAMQNVKPLQSKKHYLSHPDPKPLHVRKRQSQHIQTSQPKITYTLNHYQQVNSEEIISFKRASISQKIFSELKNAKNRYTAKLDLHGLRPEKAAAQLNNFIHHAYAQNSKIVLVIHGKGGHDHKPPVIKNLVHSYLQNFPQVLAFHSAKSQDGGSGAVYVLLRSRKF